MKYNKKITSIKRTSTIICVFTLLILFGMPGDVVLAK